MKRYGLAIIILLAFCGGLAAINFLAFPEMPDEEERIALINQEIAREVIQHSQEEPLLRQFFELFPEAQVSAPGPDEEGQLIAWMKWADRYSVFMAAAVRRMENGSYALTEEPHFTLKDREEKFISVSSSGSAIGHGLQFGALRWKVFHQSGGDPECLRRISTAMGDRTLEDDPAGRQFKEVEVVVTSPDGAESRSTLSPGGVTVTHGLKLNWGYLGTTGFGDYYELDWRLETSGGMQAGTIEPRYNGGEKTVLEVGDVKVRLRPAVAEAVALTSRMASRTFHFPGR